MNYSKEEFPGKMPVRVLQHNIINRFETFKPEALKMLEIDVKHGKVSPYFNYTISNERIKTPRLIIEVNENINVITIQEVYLSFMWSLSYYFNVYNLYYQNSLLALDGKSSNSPEFTTLYYSQNAEALFDWAISLRNQYSEWNLKLPNPEKPPTRVEDELEKQANDIFLNSIIFILYHEYAHSVKGDIESTKGIRNKERINWTQVEKYKLKEIENDADNFARQLLVNEADDDRTQIYFGYGMIMAHICDLFVINEIYDISREIHPDLDTRLFNSLDSIYIENKEYDFNIKSLAYLGIKTFFEIHNHKIDDLPKELEDMDEMLNIYQKEFDKIKRDNKKSK